MSEASRSEAISNLSPLPNLIKSQNGSEKQLPGETE
jgi:hypothetical protein